MKVITMTAMNSYYKIFNQLLKEYLDTNPKVIQITTRGFLSDEIISEDIIKKTPAKDIDVNFIKDEDGNYYWPTILADVLIKIHNKWWYFYTVQTKEAFNLNLSFSKRIDAELLQQAIKDDNTELIEELKDKISQYDDSENVNNDDFTVTLEGHKLMSKKSIWESLEIIKKNWEKKYPLFNSLKVEFVNRQL